MVLPLERVTAAEIVVLRTIHGNDAVRKIKYIGDRPVTDSVEFARLMKKYEFTIDGTHVVPYCYPGASPILPQEVPMVQRSAEQRMAEDAKTVTKDELEAEDILLKEPVSVDDDEDDDAGDYNDPPPDAAEDVMLDDKAA
jgi:hypothetical protein